MPYCKHLPQVHFTSSRALRCSTFHTKRGQPHLLPAWRRSTFLAKWDPSHLPPLSRGIRLFTWSEVHPFSSLPKNVSFSTRSEIHPIALLYWRSTFHAKRCPPHILLCLGAKWNITCEMRHPILLNMYLVFDNCLPFIKIVLLIIV